VYTNLRWVSCIPLSWFAHPAQGEGPSVDRREPYPPYPVRHLPLRLASNPGQSNDAHAFPVPSDLSQSPVQGYQMRTLLQCQLVDPTEHRLLPEAPPAFAEGSANFCLCHCLCLCLYLATPFSRTTLRIQHPSIQPVIGTWGPVEGSFLPVDTIPYGESPRHLAHPLTLLATALAAYRVACKVT